MEEEKLTEGFLFSIVVAEGEPNDKGVYSNENVKQFDDFSKTKSDRDKKLELNLQALVKEGFIFKKNMWFGKSSNSTDISKVKKLWDKTKNKDVNFLMSLLEQL